MATLSEDLAPHIRHPATPGVDSRLGHAAPAPDAMDTTAAPEFTSQLIERPRLLAELDAAEARGVRAICLVAPAGYGKTVLAEQWVKSRHPDAIWRSEERRVGKEWRARGGPGH